VGALSTTRTVPSLKAVTLVTVPSWMNSGVPTFCQAANADDGQSRRRGVKPKESARGNLIVAVSD